MNLNIYRNVTLAFNGGTKYFQESEHKNAPLIGGGYEMYNSKSLQKWRNKTEL